MPYWRLSGFYFFYFATLGVLVPYWGCVSIQNWLRNRNTIEFLGIWEQLNNPCFNPIEFNGIKKQSGLNNFILTAKQWVEKTGAIGLISKAGRYGGTYAHRDRLITRRSCRRRLQRTVS